ncbi:MAG: SEC-C metal-binding domain-containing protein [Sarcina sp.]
MAEKVINTENNEEIMELKEEMMELIEKMAKERQSKALKRKISTDLEEILSSNTRDELKYILGTLDIKFKAADKKDLLISNLKENYKEAIKRLFENINSVIYHDLKLVLNNNGILNMKEEENFKSDSYLEVLGVLFLASNENKEIYLVAPEEALEAIREIDKRLVERNDRIIKLFKGMTNYYGFVSLDQFIVNLPQDANIDLSKEDIHEILSIAEEMDGEGFYIEGNGENYFLEEPSELFELIEKEGLENGHYKRVSTEELIKASESKFVGDKNIYKPLVKLLKETYDIKGKIVDGLTEEIYSYSQFHSSKELINFMISEINPPEFIKLKLADALYKAYVRIPMWKYRGFTELEKTSVESEVAVAKIGRNEKCPCGSGKKYKKCCGK